MLKVPVGINLRLSGSWTVFDVFEKKNLAVDIYGTSIYYFVDSLMVG